MQLRLTIIIQFLDSRAGWMLHTSVRKNSDSHSSLMGSNKCLHKLSIRENEHRKGDAGFGCLDMPDYLRGVLLNAIWICTVCLSFLAQTTVSRWIGEEELTDFFAAGGFFVIRIYFVRHGHRKANGAQCEATFHKWVHDRMDEMHFYYFEKMYSSEFCYFFTGYVYKQNWRHCHIDTDSRMWRVFENEYWMNLLSKLCCFFFRRRRLNLLFIRIE